MDGIFIIAEAGSTHEGVKHRIRELIDAAKEAGANAVKFQWTSNAKKMAERRHAPELAKMYDNLLRYPTDWLYRASEHAKEVGIEFMTTVYLKEDIDVVIPLVSKFKVSSFEAADHEFILAHPRTRGLLVSHGMEDRTWVDWRGWANFNDVKHLHCVSAYPCPFTDLNLACIFDQFEGFSDHSSSVLTGMMAVCAGATLIEKHFRHPETSSNNPDYKHSLPALGKDSLKTYIDLIRSADIAMGDGVKRVMPSEEVNLKYRVR